LTAPTIYQYSRLDASLIITTAPVAADPDPMTPGSYLVPAFATLVAPGAPIQNLKQVFNTGAQTWGYVVDPTTSPGLNYTFDSGSNTWVLNTSAQAAADALTLASLKLIAIKQANSAAGSYLDAARGLSNPTEVELIIWAALQAEAIAYNASSGAPIPTITAVANANSITPATYAGTVYTQYTAYAGLIPTIAGQRQTYVNTINGTATADAVKALSFTYHS
jgi:hypothetical protein